MNEPIWPIVVIFYTRCSKCESNIDHPHNLCSNPENYGKSSRAMESLGAVKTVLDIWQNCTNGYVSTIVTDEDSTTRSKLSHSMADLVAAGRMTEAERRYRPKIAGNLGPKKDDHGELPIDHPTIEKLSDPIHFIKNYKSELWSLVALSKSKSNTTKSVRIEKNSLTEKPTRTHTHPTGTQLVRYLRRITSSPAWKNQSTADCLFAATSKTTSRRHTGRYHSCVMANEEDARAAAQRNLGFTRELQQPRTRDSDPARAGSGGYPACAVEAIDPSTQVLIHAVTTPARLWWNLVNCWDRIDIDLYAYSIITHWPIVDAQLQSIVG